jgi:hypothetical protein
MKICEQVKGNCEYWNSRTYFYGEKAEKEAESFIRYVDFGAWGVEYIRKPYVMAYGKRAIVYQSGGMDI